MFGSQDAHGPYWRVFLSMTCADALELASSPFQNIDPDLLPAPLTIPGLIGAVSNLGGLVPLLGGPCALMQKQAPSIGRILVAAGFALSCFGLILFLWIAFGGPTPLKAKSYRVTAYFPEGTQLAVESDVRIGGVSVGKVKEIELRRRASASRATTRPRP